MDTDIDEDIEDWISVTTRLPNPTMEHAFQYITLRATPDILLELFDVSEDIEDMINTENKWFGCLGMDIDVQDFWTYLLGANTNIADFLIFISIGIQL